MYVSSTDRARLGLQGYGSMVDPVVVAEAERRWRAAERQRLAELEVMPAGLRSLALGPGAASDAGGSLAHGGSGAEASGRHESGSASGTEDEPLAAAGGGDLVGDEVRAGADGVEPAEVRAGSQAFLAHSPIGGIGIVRHSAPLNTEYVPSGGIPTGEGQFNYPPREGPPTNGDEDPPGESQAPDLVTAVSSPPPAPGLAATAHTGGVTAKKPSRRRPAKTGAKKP